MRDAPKHLHESDKHIAAEQEAAEQAFEETGHVKHHHLSAVLDLTEDAIISVNSKLQIRYFNRGAEKIFGYAASEVMGRSFEPLLSEPARQLHHQFIQDFATSRVHSQTMDKRMEICGLRKNGTEFPAETSITKIESPMGTVFTVIMRDNTELKCAQEALLRAHDELEQRVQVRTKELNDAREEAELANQSKTELLSRLSHDFRTPMTAILGFGELLEADDEPVLSDTQMDYTRHIINAGYHLLDLINEMLDLSRIESGNIKIEFESIDCNALMHECVALIKPLADKHGVNIENQITHSQAIMLRGERIRLKEVVLNLLSNSVKYNREQGQIILSAEELSANRMRILFNDTGPGLSEEQQERLFKPYERLGAEYSEIEGTGIGLSISKHLIDLMGGEIGVNSIPDVGSTFWIELDTASEARPVQAIQVTNSRGNQHKLLYIEDNPANLRLVEYALKSRPNIELLSAMTPEQGLKIAIDSQPTLILLDINIPETDSYEMLIQLRKAKETSDIPVIAISDYAMHHDLEKKNFASISDCLTKPFGLEHFYELIDRSLALMAG